MDLRYPIGPYVPPAAIATDDRRRWIEDLAALPALVRTAAEPLSEAELDTRYRPGGWTLRQVVHHLADSHLNAFVRYKWALTEDEPAIKAYDERAWAETPDARAPAATSLALLDALHARWTDLLRSLDADAWSRALVHPERGRLTLDAMLPHYAWHGRHHLAHITTTVRREA